MLGSPRAARRGRKESLVSEKSLGDLDPRVFEQHLTPQVLRPLQILPLALVFGVVAFTSVVAVLHFGGLLKDAEPPKEDMAVLITALSGVTCAMTLGAWFGLPVFLKVFFVPARFTIEEAAGEQEMSQAVLKKFQGVHILSCAFLEAGALFGVAACFLAANFGVLGAQPLYWLNAVPAGLFVIFVLATFPTRYRLVDLFERRVRDAR
jgi:hypothetical protein